MKQLTFEKLVDLWVKLPIPFTREVQEELVARMAEAIVAVHKEGGERDEE